MRWIGSVAAIFLFVVAATGISKTTASLRHPAATIAIDATANVHPINPQIYGVAFASSKDLKALNAPLNRMDVWGSAFLGHTYSAVISSPQDS